MLKFTATTFCSFKRTISSKTLKKQLRFINHCALLFRRLNYNTLSAIQRCYCNILTAILCYQQRNDVFHTSFYQRCFIPAYSKGVIVPVNKVIPFFVKL